MARPNSGKGGSNIIAIRVNDTIKDEFKRRAMNLREELMLYKDKNSLLKSSAHKWKIKAVYEP